MSGRGPQPSPIEAALKAISSGERVTGACLELLKVFPLPTGTQAQIFCIPLHGGVPDIRGVMHFLQGRVVQYCLSRPEIHEELEQCEGNEDRRNAAVQRLASRARRAFVRASRGKSRSGECGEMLLYALIEDVYRAPHLISKMALKTSRKMHFHGVDAVHVGMDGGGSLTIYFGESKMHARFAEGLSSGLASIEEAFDPGNQDFEIDVIRRHAITELAALPAGARKQILNALNPFGTAKRSRNEVHVLLVSFNYSLGEFRCEQDYVERIESFCQMHVLPKIELAVAEDRFKSKTIEVLLLPVEKVQELRDAFNDAVIS